MTTREWDLRFLEMAKLVSTWSKDPSTKAGAVIVRPDRSIVAVGYNGFPRRMRDDPELYANREAKYSRIVHCEINAILQAGQSVAGCTLYTWPFMPCDRCAVQVIQAGIARAVSVKPDAERAARWNFGTPRSYFEEAFVECVELEC